MSDRRSSRGSPCSAAVARIPEEALIVGVDARHQIDQTQRDRIEQGAQIGSALGITEVTVKLHVSRILAKLGVSDRTEAATSALLRGIVQIEP